MGIFIDYAFHVECSEAELLARLRRLREKLVTLPFDSVSEIIAVDPVYNPLFLNAFADSGAALPDGVKVRIEGKRHTRHEEWCLILAAPEFIGVPKEMHHRFYQPALDFRDTTELWRAEDLPEKIEVDFGLTLFRGGFEVEFASVMLRHGYVIAVQPCEGCETFTIGLSTFRVAGTPFWLGGGFSKTMYATRFVEAHESICKALDFAGEEQLLYSAKDTCGFYGHRDWSRSAEIVNQETTVTKALTDAMRIGIEHARKKGLAIRDVSSPATRNYNLIRVKKKKNEDDEESLSR